MFTTSSTAAVQFTGAALVGGLGRCQARAATSRVLSSLLSHRYASTSAASSASSHRLTQRAAKKSTASGSLFLRREHDLGSGRGLKRTFCSSVSRKQQDGRAHPNLQSYQKLRDHQHQHSLPSSPHEHDRIKSVLIVNKLRTKPVVEAIETLLAHIHTKYPGTKVYHEDRPDIPKGVDVWQPGTDAQPIDLVVTLGGDGTILHASSLFKKGAVPPVLSFSMGTLGFLLPFHIDDFAPALESAFTGKATVLYRMRLSCTFHDSDGNRIGKANDEWQVMNEIALHRGREPHLSTIDTFVDGQHLTESVGDGLIVSTPTGSTAYSLSAGGPIVHPSLSAMVLTPICPRSLSFRPLVFPSSSSITLRIGERSRAPAGVSMDGQEARVLAPGESVTVRASPYPIPCINRSSIAADSAYGRGEEGAGPGAEDDWVRDINNLLQYNATFRSKALLRYSRP